MSRWAPASTRGSTPSRAASSNRSTPVAAQLMLCRRTAVVAVAGGSERAVGAIGDALVFQPTAVLLPDQVAAVVQFVTQVDRNALGSLRVDDGTVLGVDEV